jgi:hypothetical protein
MTHAKQRAILAAMDRLLNQDKVFTERRASHHPTIGDLR